MTNATKTPRKAVPWPGKVRGGQIVNNLRRLSPAVVGPDPAGLAEMIDEAMQPLFLRTGETVDDLLTADQRRAFGETVGVIMGQMATMMQVVPADQTVRLWPGDFGGLDPVIVAAEGFRLDQEGAAGLADVYRKLATIEQVPPTRARGMAPVVDAVFMLARVVVVYRHKHGLPIESDWNCVRPEHRGDRKGKRYSDEECKPKGETAELLCIVTREWEIQGVDHSTLKGALDAYLATLKRDGREPEEDDAVPIFFGAK